MDQLFEPQLSSRTERSDVPPTFRGGGEMGARIHAFPWSETPLGPIDSWPKSLTTAVQIMLTSRQPIWLGWGPTLIKLYNDPYQAIAGGKHPAALGQPAVAVWREIWDDIGPMLTTAMRGDEGTYVEAQLLIMERNGYPEETYYTFSYSPIPDDDGGVGGIICANTDDTQRVIGERQMALLRDLAAVAADTRTVAEACARSADALSSNQCDLPFALLYLLDPERRVLGLAGASGGVDRGSAVAPDTLDLEGGAIWPSAAVLDTGALQLVDAPAESGGLPSGGWDQPPQQIAILPIAAQGSGGPIGLLAAGLNPYRLFDDQYQRFLDLVAAQISTSIANAQAYEAERQRAEALAALDRAKTTFFANISHEFRTPLTLLLGPIEDAIQQSGRARPELREPLEIAHRNALRLLRLVNSLLDFARIEAGRVAATYVPTDLAALTADLASVFRSTIEHAGLALVVDCPPLDEPVYVDRTMWETVVLNLLSNAFKFTFSGTIAVTLRRAGPAVELAVSDTGIGVPASELPRLFERFHRVSGAHGRTFEGSGIGLALVQELARLHGGAVRAESVEGQGTTFTVTLPLGAAHLPKDQIGAAQDEPGPQTSGAAYVEEARRWLPDDLVAPAVAHDLVGARPEVHRDGVARPRILLADDNADIRAYIRRLLSHAYEVDAAVDGVDALRAARANRPDLVLADVMMPGLDGFGLLRELRADPQLRTIPIILLSARAGEEARVDGIAAGADDYLIKPFSARELLARVSSRLELARLHTQLDQERAALTIELAARTRAEVALRDNEERLQVLYAHEQAARAQAEEASRLKDEFLATVSHELRTPLTAYLGYAQLLQRRTSDAAYVARTAERLVQSARDQAQLIDDLLDVSRAVSGKLRIDPRRIDLGAVIHGALDTIRPMIDAKGQTVDLDLASQVSIIGDANRLQQVMWNLLANASKFTPDGGRIAIQLARVGDEAHITVRDTGRGIGPEFLPYVFDRFRQADSTSQRSQSGLGLGLAIVRHLVELHGGAAEATSEGEGRGSTFVIRLPRAAGPPHARPDARRHDGAGPRVQHPPDLSGLRILLVDDQPGILDLLVEILAPCGAAVQTATGAVEALDRLQAESPDLIISDIAMPERDGYWLISQIRALPPDAGGAIPAAALTAYVRVEERLRVLAAGFQQYVPKPIDADELLAVIVQLAGGIDRRFPDAEADGVAQ